jgi:carbonic anhydrase/acetyltransferase-like protein (isoleucine patch superfamily)
MGDLVKQLDTFLRAKPRLGKNVYITKSAVVLGDVRVGDYSSIWYNATVRGDINYIEIGHHTNIQDNAVLHLADDYPCIIGNYVTVGHSAIVHACTIGNEVLIGMGAIVLDGAVVEDQCLIGANAMVTNGMRVPAGSLVLGTPGKIARALSPEERAGLKPWADKYVENSAYCLQHSINVGGPMPA